MALFTKELFAKEGDEAGVFMDGLGRALVTWTAMQDRVVGVTVHDAAMAFNTTEEIIAEACEEAMWISIEGNQLVLDGE